MTTLICSGGSGTRVLEAVLHLCAAGLGPPKLRLLVIDPDSANGNGARTRKLLNSYDKCQKAFGNKTGGLPFFQTELDLLPTEGGDKGLKTWSPVAPNQTLRDVLNYALLTPLQKDIVHLLFADEELEMPLKVGFKGHPSIGAATMALLSLYREQQPWKQLDEKIRGEVTETDGSAVMIAGSVFGGTGASVFHPLARFLRSIPKQNADRLKIGAVALVPYFRFEQSTLSQSVGAQAAAAKSEWFALATRSAAEFYDHLRQNDTQGFEAMYWLGDDSPMQVKYSDGDEYQVNPAHVVDLLAGIACLDFLKSQPNTQACNYAGPRESSEEELKKRNVVCWEDIPLSAMDRDVLRTRLLTFYLVGAAHLGFFQPLFKDPRADHQPFCIPWYLDRFAGRGDYFGTPENQDQMQMISEFFSQSHLPWWKQIHDTDLDRIRLFNRTAMRPSSNDGVVIDMFHLANLLREPSNAVTADKVDRFFADVVAESAKAGEQRGVPGYLAHMGRAAERFVQREYKKMGVANA